MPKAASPVRLQQSLMQAATIAGQLSHRSAAEQIEYWASIGRQVSKTISPESMLALSTGLAQIRIDPVPSPSLNIEDVFDNLEACRQSGQLADMITDSEFKYQSSKSSPGFLERISADGSVSVGQFHMGVFTPISMKN